MHVGTRYVFQADRVVVHPLYLMLPATLSAQFAYMLPPASAAHVLTLNSKRVTVTDMVSSMGLIDHNKLHFYFSFKGFITVAISTLSYYTFMF